MDRMVIIVLLFVGIITASVLWSQKQPEPQKPTPAQPRSAKGESSNSKVSGLTTHSSGLKYAVLRKGKGASPKGGQRVKVHYTGWLLKGYNPGGSPIKGKQFDSSRKRGVPFQFNLWRRNVIRGWDIGVSMMKKGGRRLFVLPPQLAYGRRGAGRVIPPNATLVFDVELLDFK